MTIQGIRLDDGDTTWGTEARSHEWGLSERAPRVGVSVCADWDDLCAYFGHSPDGSYSGRVYPRQIADSHLVTVEGVESPDQDHDHGADGNPYLIADPKPVATRELTAQDVAQLIYDHDSDEVEDLARALNEMLDAYGDRDVVEEALQGLRDNFADNEVDSDEYGEDLDGLPAGSYVVAAGAYGEALVWDTFEYAII